MSERNWLEALAHDHFGPNWTGDAAVCGFVEAAARPAQPLPPTDRDAPVALLGELEPDGMLRTRPHGGIRNELRYEEQLSSAYAELARASRFKDQFFAAVSHELRTPLNPILGLSDSLRTGVYGELAERQLGALAHIEENAHQLHRLIEDILEISAFEFGDVELVFSPARVGDLFEKLLAAVAPRGEAKGISISVCPESPEGHFYVDSPRVEKVLAILMDNAIKFTPPGGQVILEAAADEDADTLAFTVRDNGIGIAEEDQPGLFQSFGQVDRKLARAYNGAGIGLALVKHMAEQHGGSVAVASVLGEGSCFTVSLPLRTRFEDLPADPSPKSARLPI